MRLLALSFLRHTGTVTGFAEGKVSKLSDKYVGGKRRKMGLESN
jgi:hypothetical protein